MARSVLAILLAAACASQPAARRREASPSPAPRPAEAVFTASVRPVLKKSCTPCHEPGGKMYEKIPFDDPSAVRAHEGGVRKRLKGEDLAAFEAWLKSPP